MVALTMALAACADDNGAEDAPDADGTDEGAEGEGEGEAVDFPTREVTLITRGGPGGGHDIMARGLAPMLEEELGVTVIVENMEGGAGLVAADYMRGLDPDGHTLHIMDPVGLIGYYVATEEDYTFEDFDFEILGTATERPTTIAVADQSSIETCDDFLAEAEAGTLRWAHTGTSSTHALNTFIMFDALGYELPTLIPHDSTPDVFVALARFDGDFTALAIDSVANAAEEGDVRPLLHFAEEPMDEQIPDLAVGADCGLEQFDGLFTSSLALTTTAGTDPAIVDILQTAVENVVLGEEFEAWGEESGQVVNGMGADDTREQLQGVVELYSGYQEILAQYAE